MSPETVLEQGQEAPARVPGFVVSLPQFEGPFDLLLTLIARRRLDVTELALAEVTDEFLATMHASWELEHASEFLVVAATLLALKARRLLPHEDEEDEDLELIEARDLLFARLLQYRAFKQAATAMAARAETVSRSHPRVVALPPELAGMLPHLIAHVSPTELAQIAARALTRPAEPGVQTVHLHEPVPVRPQLGMILARLREQGPLTFTELVADVWEDLPTRTARSTGLDPEADAPAGDQLAASDEPATEYPVPEPGQVDLEAQERARAVVVARFLALLILHREGAVDLTQDHPMGEITVALTGEEGAGTGMIGRSERPDLEEEFA